MDPLVRPEFDRWRAWVQQQRLNGATWEQLELAKKSTVEELLFWIDMMCKEFDFPSLGTTADARREAWVSIVSAKRRWEEEAARNDGLPVVVGREGTERRVEVPTDPRSCWQLYRKHLLTHGFRAMAVDAIEMSSLMVLRRMRFITPPGQAVKGLVVGHVQSGKTASMAGLIAMAADWGWNVVIVLTGTLENLRLQTERRIFGDLNRSGNLVWRKLQHPNGDSPVGDRAQDCHLSPDSKQRYLIVALKNERRLENLKDWLVKDLGSRGQMRILVIDDEADQAGIDTADRARRSTINRQLVELTQVGAAAVNYVAYTATPYANFLNEAYPESLYPQDFIITLPQSDEHFGPEQIFGIEATESAGGLGVVNEVSAADVVAVRDLHTGASPDAPDSLVDALCWFVCAVAAVRFAEGPPRPISMLVHTSSAQAHHDRVDDVIRRVLTQHPDYLILRCRDVWREQVQHLTREDFAARLPGYGRLRDVRDYPAFDDLAVHIREVLARTTPILMAPTMNGPEPEFHRGLHLCIDNCAMNGINDENEHLRLLYPDRAQMERLGTSPAFVVVGGSTLSRGLTIENLVSTYFLRGGAQMDTLMQMGRWFGYRRGIELLPRIWMPDETRRKFVFMAGVEKELRDDLRRFMDAGADPKDYGPRVRVHPRASWLRPTAKNKMRAAVADAYDFSGTNRQTTIFHARPEDEGRLRANLAHTETFLASLGDGTPSARAGALVWHSVALERVGHFLRGLAFHERMTFFSELDPFLGWCREHAARYGLWNVVVSGPAGNSQAVWLKGAVEVRKVSRTRVIDASDADSVSIGTLRDPRDLLADAPTRLDVPANAGNSEIARLREQAGLGATPQLLVYRIDRDSRAPDGSPSRGRLRADLNVPDDLVGVSIWLPDAFSGDRRTSFTAKVTVRIPPELRVENDDAIEDLADAS